MKDLKRCPVCGGKAAWATRIEGYGFCWSIRIKCVSCGLQTAPVMFGDTGELAADKYTRDGETEAKARAWKRWNTRIA